MEASHSHSDQLRFGLLFFTLMVALLGAPLVPDSLSGVPSVQFFLTAIVFAGIYAASRERRVLLVGALIAVPSIAITWVRELGGYVEPWLAMVDHATDAVFFGFLAVVVYRGVISAQRVTTDTILGGICVYLLLGFLFAVLFSVMEFLRPGTFQERGQPLLLGSSVELEGTLLRELVYFSFVTITTLGYGDITPTTDAARHFAVAEAIVGPLFVAVFIARLVALRLAHTRPDPG